MAAGGRDAREASRRLRIETVPVSGAGGPAGIRYPCLKRSTIIPGAPSSQSVTVAVAPARRGRSAMSEGKPFPLNAWYAAAWSHEIKHELVGAHDLRQRCCALSPQRRREWSRSRTRAGIACCRSRSAGSRATKWSAAITGSCSIRPGAAPTCRRRRPSIHPPPCARIRRSSAIAGVDLARRSGAGGSGQDAGFSLERWHGLGR